MSAFQTTAKPSRCHDVLMPPERAALNTCGLAAQAHFHQTVAAAVHPGLSFTCGRCKASFAGEGRSYPGSRLAGQPEMRVCEACEGALQTAAGEALAHAPLCSECGKRKAAHDGKQCWPCWEHSQRAASPARVVLLPIAFEMLARAAKARTMARLLTSAGISAADVARMTAADWNQFHVGLVSRGILTPGSTTPTAGTIARTIAEVRAIEASAFRSAIARPGCTSAAPVRVRRRKAA